MKKRISLPLALTLTLTFHLSPFAQAQTGPQTTPNLQDALQQMQQLLQGGATNAAAQVVNFRELKALLPESVEGLKRTSASGEKSGALGMTISFAEGIYETDDGGRVTLKISDMGGMGGMMKMAQAGWAMAEIDRETDTGFERTSTFKGLKTHEEYDEKYHRGKIQIMAYERYQVEVSGSRVPYKFIEALRDAVPLDKLEALKPDAPAEGQ